MGYKENCGFRKIDLCKFHEEDCTPEKCDMHKIPFTAKAILKQAGIERKAVKKLTLTMIDMKKRGEHKVNKDKYEQMKQERNDKAYGMLKLSKAYMHCKRVGL